MRWNRRHAISPRVVIIGAGFGGIATGIKLKKAGITTFTIFDKAPSVGGTWWHNQYPGCEVDVISYVYSFAFKRYDWTRTHARQPELHAYLEETVTEYGLRPHLRLGRGVERAEWNAETRTYALTLDNGEALECDVLIAATGFLNIPNMPTWPGLDSFQGPKFHTARWEHEHDLTGKTVALVGTGSTASQIVPEIVPIVKQLYLFQREPGWVLPKGDRNYSAEDRARLRNPLRHRWDRIKWFWMAEKNLWRAGTYRPGSPKNEASKHVALKFIEREFADRPDLKEAVTPSYPYWGKRTIFNSTFYAALKSANVELVPRAVTSVTPTGIIDVDGVERAVDIIVIATGFQPTNYLGTIEIVGVDGLTLQKFWNGEPRAFLGITVPKFPNLFILYGPGTNGGEILKNLLAQAKHAVDTVKRMQRTGIRAVEVKKTWADMYDAWLQSKMEGTSWEVSHNYFASSTGKIVTQWPYSTNVYGAMVRVLGRRSLKTR